MTCRVIDEEYAALVGTPERRLQLGGQMQHGAAVRTLRELAGDQPRLALQGRVVDRADRRQRAPGDRRWRRARPPRPSPRSAARPAGQQVASDVASRRGTLARQQIADAADRVQHHDRPRLPASRRRSRCTTTSTALGVAGLSSE